MKYICVRDLKINTERGKAYTSVCYIELSSIRNYMLKRAEFTQNIDL